VIKTQIKPDNTIPPNGVVATDRKTFGGRNTHAVPDDIAQTVIRKVGDPSEVIDIKRDMVRDYVVEDPRLPATSPQIGAGDRRNGRPLDDQLRKTHMFGGRDPVKPAGNDQPKTGAVDRDPTRKTQVRHAEGFNGNGSPVKVDPERDRSGDTKRERTPVKVDPKNTPAPDTKRTPAKPPQTKSAEPSKKTDPAPTKVDHKAPPIDSL